MHRRVMVVLAGFIVSALCGSLVRAEENAAAPPKLNYQAVLEDGSGNPITTNTSVVFTIWDAEVGGNSVWTETRSVAPDAQGRFSIVLGENTPFTDAVFSGSSRWLGLKVGADVAEMPQRMALTSSPYSFRVNTVDGATAGRVKGNLTLESASVGQGSKLVLLGESADSIQIGPAHEGVAFRAMDATGDARLEARINGNAQMVVSSAAGDSVKYTSRAAEFYGNTTLFRGAAVNSKRAELGQDGMVFFGGTEAETLAVLRTDGSLKLLGNLDLKWDSSLVLAEGASASSAMGGLGCGNNFLSGYGNGTSASVEAGWIPGGCYSFSLGAYNRTHNSFAFASGENNHVDARNGLALGSNNFIEYNSTGSAAFGYNNHLGYASPNIGEAGSSVALGRDNIVQATQSFAVGIRNLIASGGGNNIAMGDSNTILANTYQDFVIGRANIVGGSQNFASGYSNKLLSNSSSIFGQLNLDSNGTNNSCFGSVNAIRGASNCGILGGHLNYIFSSSNSVIVSGNDDSIRGSSFSIIAGGQRNAIDTADNGGTAFNVATISGGSDNVASNNWATVSGGEANGARGWHSTVSGGGYNSATGNGSTVVGGSADTAAGWVATVAGGAFNRALGDYSFAAGRQAKSDHHGTFVWADQSGGDFASTAVDQFLVRATGGVGLGTNSTHSQLTVEGDVTPGTDNASDLGSSAWRWNEVWATNGTISTSDLRLKRDVSNLRYGLADVNRLRPVTYRWKSDKAGTPQIGLIAQEVQEVIPEAVAVGDDEKASLGLHYDKLVPVLINAVQELDARTREIEQLKNQLAELQTLMETVLAERAGSQSGNPTLSVVTEQ